jgi:hypothetical protein
MALQTIELEIKNEAEEGIFALSYVLEPAIEENWVALSKNQIELKVVDEERRIVVGFALVPDKEIYRKQEIDGKMVEFNIKFSKQTVAKAGELFMKNLNGNNATIEHERPVEGVSTIELWIVEDPKNDKSNIYGLNPKGGELVVMQKVYNNELWEDVKSGKVKGFSIEAMFNGFEKLKFSSDELDVIEELKKAVGYSEKETD